MFRLPDAMITLLQAASGFSLAPKRSGGCWLWSGTRLFFTRYLLRIHTEFIAACLTGLYEGGRRQPERPCIVTDSYYESIRMANFTCDVDERYRSACEGLDFYSEHKGKRYCVLHFPGEDKKDRFEKQLNSKLTQKDYDFGGVCFPGDTAAFGSREFEKPVSFSEAIFKGAVDFSAWRKRPYRRLNVTFKKGADFRFATFEKGVTFSRATFEKEANFNHTTFKDEARFSGPGAFEKARVDFQDARMDEPKLFSMHDIKLRPSWFVEVDARKFNFAKVKWYGLPGGPKGSLKEEIDHFKRGRRVRVPYAPLVKALQDLSTNYEENRDYKLAGEFHYWAMDTLIYGQHPLTEW
jgi:hypothetical protein